MMISYAYAKPEDAESTDLFVRFLFKTLGSESRKAELSERIDGILGADLMTAAESLSLRSRLLFAESQLFGRFAKSALKTIGSVSLAGRTMHPLPEELKHSLRWMKDRVVNSPARRIDTFPRPTMFSLLGWCVLREEGRR